MSPAAPHVPKGHVAELIRKARETGDTEALIEAIPYARFLGLTVERADGMLRTRLRFAPHIIGNPLLPALHGGTIGALMESAAVFTLVAQTETESVPKIVTLSVDYLRSGRPQDTLAEATITRLGRRVANVRVEAWQEDRARPIAAAHALFLL
jgi:uncharacterized protein (TIGR00369 family)